VVLNHTPVVRHDYRVGVPFDGVWEEVLNSDAAFYGGSGVGNAGELRTTALGAHGREHALSLTLPPLAALFLRPRGAREPLT
jgi:1,4-alpha-glucan branching enzyme